MHAKSHARTDCLYSRANLRSAGDVQKNIAGGNHATPPHVHQSLAQDELCRSRRIENVQRLLPRSPRSHSARNRTTVKSTLLADSRAARLITAIYQRWSPNASRTAEVTALLT